MSISSLNSTINRLQKEIADLQHKLSLESKKESDTNSRIGQIRRSITRSTSESPLRSKSAEIQRKENDIARIQVKKSDLMKKMADKQSKLSKAREDLAKEEERQEKQQIREQEREQRRLAELERRQQDQQIARQKQLQDEIRKTIELTAEANSISSSEAEQQDDHFDVFISHASEDKDEFVRPLAEALADMGIKVWYDEFTLRVGDSLRKRIDHGLAKARFGVVIISSAFLSKNWTQYELDGMVSREMNGHKMILPIWHKVTKDDVVKFSPTLADKVALNTSISSVEEIADQLKEVILD